jgi:hypothetical protein
MDILLYIIPAIAITGVITWLIVRSVLTNHYNKLLSDKQEEINVLKNQNVVLQEKNDSQNRSLEEVRKAMIDTFRS